MIARRFWWTVLAIALGVVLGLYAAVWLDGADNTPEAAGLNWQGLFVGVEQTRDWRSPQLPGVSASATAVVSIGRVGLRAVYIQPLRTTPKLGPMVQVGASVRLF